MFILQIKIRKKPETLAQWMAGRFTPIHDLYEFGFDDEKIAQSTMEVAQTIWPDAICEIFPSSINDSGEILF